MRIRCFTPLKDQIARGRYGYCDPAGKIVIEPIYQKARPFHEGLAAVQKGGRFGYIDKNGAVVVKFQFVDALDYHNGKALVGTAVNTTQESSYVKMERIKYSLIDKTGAILGDTDLHLIGDYSEGLAPALTDEGYFFLDENYALHTLVPESYSFYSGPVFHEGLALVRKEESSNVKFFFINQSGDVVIDNDCYSAQSFSDGLAPLAPNADTKLWGYIDRNDIYVIEPKFMNAYGFGEGIACAKEPDGDWIVINKKGQEVTTIQAAFDVAKTFHEGLCAVGQAKKGPMSANFHDQFYDWGFIDTAGKLVIDFQYDLVTPFKNGIAQVLVDGKIGYIDKMGKYIWEPK